MSEELCWWLYALMFQKYTPWLIPLSLCFLSAEHNVSSQIVLQLLVCLSVPPGLKIMDSETVSKNLVKCIILQAALAMVFKSED